MSTFLVGNVYYDDDAEKKIFRRILPERDDGEIAKAKCDCGCGKPLWRSHTNPDRTPVLEIVMASSERAQCAMSGAV